MHYPTDRIAHTTAFVTPVVEHWLEREIDQWVHPMKDRSDDPSHHERTLSPRSYISLPCAVRCLKNGKASGEDDIINEHIKPTVDILLPFYVTMFNKIFDTGIIPDTWLNGVILPIYIYT